MLKKLRLMLLGLLLSLLASCATPPDVPICTELDERKGWCTHLISEREFYVDDFHLYDNENWVQVDTKSLRLPARSWAKLKAFMLTQCKRSKKCANNLGKWSRKAKRIDSKVNGDSLLSQPH